MINFIPELRSTFHTQMVSKAPITNACSSNLLIIMKNHFGHSPRDIKPLASESPLCPW